MDIDYFAIGKRIRKRRKDLKMTQANLAELANLSDSNISHIERGATKLSLPSIISIANALDTTVDNLLMDNIKSSDIEFKIEFADLLKNCSVNEYNLLYDTCKILLKTFEKYVKSNSNN